jgi:cation transport ATPase
VKPAPVLHETSTRLRLQAPPGVDLATLRAGLARIDGVASVRVNARLRCVVVGHDGRRATRDAVLGVLASPVPAARRDRTRPGRRQAVRPGSGAQVLAWTPGIFAAAVPVLPADWRPGAALAAVAARVAAQHERLRRDPPAVLLDAASLAALAVGGQPLVVSASVLLRLLSEALSDRLVRQADALLSQVMPELAAQYHVLRDAGAEPAADWRAWPLRAVRAGDRLRLYPGEVSPVDGCVTVGEATLRSMTAADEPRAVVVGDHVAAGEQLLQGTLELVAESDPAHSRLQRLRAQLQHAIGARDPAGQLAPGLDRLLALPLTGAALVFGLTGDTGRAAAMLQADARQGLDLALPVAREAALYALARNGLVGAGLESIERLAVARTLVLQDSSVVAQGRWTVEVVETEPGGDVATVRQWLAALAGVPLEALDTGGLPDLLVRQWVRHGAVLPVGQRELHLASPRRLQRLWRLEMPARAAAEPAQRASGPLRRRFAVVTAGRVVGSVTLASALRAGLRERLASLRALGFARIAVFEEDGGDLPPPAGDVATWRGHAGLDALDDDLGARADWLAEATHEGEPLVMVHTVLRDLVPPGSLSLTPADAEVGAHGVLIGDPLASLEAGRRLALVVHRRLRVQQGSATAANALLMTAAALRWLPPIATALLHHGFALLVLLDSIRLEKIGASDGPLAPAPPGRSPSVPRVPQEEIA